MGNGDINILTGNEVLSLLQGRELEIIDTIRSAYEAHQLGQSSLPHSTFLRFPEDDRNRIIALPAYLGGQFAASGMKWVSSFPGNVEKGLDRASAVIILNSADTGRAEAVLEGSIISAKRTAASAALAAQWLHSPGPEHAGIYGAGLINFEIARFLIASQPALKSLAVFDLNRDRATQFRNKCLETFDDIEVEVVSDSRSMLRECSLISFATTAGTPHISDLSDCTAGTTILHISLRDIAPAGILSADNVVDDVDHVCRAQTSLHLTEQQTGNREFIRCSLADILLGREPARKNKDTISVFSPFGLGVLDLALSKLVVDRAVTEGQGQVVKSFLPDSWVESRETVRT